MSLANGRTHLAIPGPSIMPDAVLQAMHRAAPNIYEGDIVTLVEGLIPDLRKVAWDKGLVRCGMNRWNKPMFHDSEVAAIAWSIQQILYRRGFLDIDGNQIPVEELVSRYARRQASGHGWYPAEVEDETPSGAVEPLDGKPAESAAEGAGPAVVGNCPECRGELIMMDGCPTCYAGCGWSKCG